MRDPEIRGINDDEDDEDDGAKVGAGTNGLMP